MILVATHDIRPVPTCPSRKPLKRNTILGSKLKTRASYSSNSKTTSIAHEELKRRCECFDLHNQLVPYAEAWDWQKSIVKKKKALKEMNEDCVDTLFVLQHRPVYTLGTGSSVEYLDFAVEDAPFDIFRTERGGEVTYHGPGQLVMYPIINLRYHKMDLHWYLRALEEVIIQVLFSTFSIKASRVEGFTGVWVGDQKLAAIGVSVSQWITYHGLALNVTTDLTPFQQIVPCGIRNRQVGSIKGLLGKCLPPDYVIDDRQLIDITHNSLIKEFSKVFQLELHQVPISALEGLQDCKAY